MIWYAKNTSKQDDNNVMQCIWVQVKDDNNVMQYIWVWVKDNNDVSDMMSEPNDIILIVVILDMFWC